MKLYELTGALRRLWDVVTDPETGEVNDGEVEPGVSFEDALASLEGQIEDKLNGCAIVIASLKADVDTLKKEEARLKNRRTSLEGSINRLKGYMQRSMTEAGLKKVKTLKYTIWIAAGRPRVEIVDESIIPTEYRKQELPPPDKQAIKSALEQGEKVPGAILEKGDPSLSIR